MAPPRALSARSTPLRQELPSREGSGRGMVQGTSWAAAPAAPAAVSCRNPNPAGERRWLKPRRLVVQSLTLVLLFPVQVCHKPSKRSALKLDLQRQHVALGFELHSSCTSKSRMSTCHPATPQSWAGRFWETKNAQLWQNCPPTTHRDFICYPA